MENGSIVPVSLGRRTVPAAVALLALALILVLLPSRTQGQEVQKDFRGKFNIADNTGGIGVATSADGKYVYVAGPQGVLVSDDFGKTGSWVQTVRLK